MRHAHLLQAALVDILLSRRKCAPDALVSLNFSLHTWGMHAGMLLRVK